MTSVSAREITIPTRRGPMRARLYEPAGAHHRAALLTSGLHASGIDEPRLVRLAQQIAGSHIAVVTPDIPELSHFEIAPAITDAIEDAGAVAVVGRGARARSHRGADGNQFQRRPLRRRRRPPVDGESRRLRVLARRPRRPATRASLPLYRTRAAAVAGCAARDARRERQLRPGAARLRRGGDSAVAGRSHRSARRRSSGCVAASANISGRPHSMAASTRHAHPRSSRRSARWRARCPSRRRH